MTERARSRQSSVEERKSIISDFQNNFVSYQAGKLQVWVRLRPSPTYDENIFEISEDGKSFLNNGDWVLPLQNIRLSVETEERGFHAMSQKTVPTSLSHCLNFKADGILQCSTQEEAYFAMVRNTVEKAMNGVSGVIVSLGPETSGKTFSLFGVRSKYEHRGIVPRALEDLFQYAETRSQDMNFVIRMGMVEIRRNKIHDLLTLGPYELKTIGEDGPNGMLFQQIGCAEHGLVLLIRGLAGQRMISGDLCSRSHIVVYLDILGESFEYEPRIVKSRITFAKIAAIPRRSKDLGAAKMTRTQPTYEPRVIQLDGCAYISLPAPPQPPILQQVVNLDPPVKTDQMADDIAIRRDLAFLEQMFIRVSELKRLNKIYAKLKRTGMQMIIKRPKPAPSQSYRQNKLSHCLQDIISGCSEVRIILHIRPEKEYLATTLEAMRFAERAKCVPQEDPPPPPPPTPTLETSNKELADAEEAEKKAAEGQDSKGRVRAASDPDWDSSEFPRRHSKASDPELRRKSTKESSEKSDPTGGDPRDTSPSKNKEKELKGKKSKHRGKKNRKRDVKSGSYTTESKAKGRGSSIAGSEAGSELTSDTAKQTSDLEGSEPKKPGEDEGEGNFTDFSVYSNVEREGLDGSEAENKDAPTKAEAWSEFLKTGEGAMIIQELNFKQSLLRDCTAEHNEALQKVTSLLAALNQNQTDLDIAQQNRHLNGDEYDVDGNIIVPPEERDIFQKIRDITANRDAFLERLKSLKAQLHAQKKIVDAGRAECESQFQTFCLERYAIVFGKEGGDLTKLPDPTACAPPPENVNSTCNLPRLLAESEVETNKHYKELKRLAKEQAKQFLRLYPKRPPWTHF